MSQNLISPEELWETISEEAQQEVLDEPVLAGFFHANILGHQSLCSALAYLLSRKLHDDAVPAVTFRLVIEEVFRETPSILDAVCADIMAIRTRDPAIEKYSTALLFLKGFHAIQAYRVAHYMWNQGRKSMGLYIQSRVSCVLQVDIHPAATIGSGVMFDHATGIVVGETSVIENDVSILQSVTLGGTGKVCGDRHPKIREGVMIAAGAKIFGNIEVGKGAKIGGGSVVLDSVPAHTTVVGVPAREVGHPHVDKPAFDMDQYVLHDKD